MKQFNNYKARDISFAIILVVVIALFIFLFSRCTKYEQVILPYYDTTFVVITDFDTTRIITQDTIYIYIVVYDTVRTIVVGNQHWMKGDLQTTIYNDGTPIEIATSNAIWSEAKPLCCYYKNDFNNHILYNWYAVQTERLCPIGFRVPSEADWIALEDYLGDDSKRGGKLKEVGFTHWMRPNAEATDDFGWTAIPKDFRYQNGEWGIDNGFVVQTIKWWSLSIDPETNLPIYRQVQYNMGNIVKWKHLHNMGFSVRCLKN